MLDLGPQEIQVVFKYLEDPDKNPLPENLQQLTDLELMSLQLILDQLKWERRDAVLH